MDHGALSRAAYERYLLPADARTVGEALAPLRRAGSPAAEVDGRSYAAFVRAFAESTLRDGLVAPGALRGRAPADLLDDRLARLAERFDADPERDRFEDWTLTVVLQRRGRPA